MANPITIARGEDKQELFTIALNGAAVPLDAVGITLFVSRYDNGPMIFTKRNATAGGSDAEIELLDQSDPETKGMFKVKFSDADTLALEENDYTFDVWLSDGGDDTQAIPPTPFRVTGRAMPYPITL